LTRIQGIHESAALSLIAEIGVDMYAWKTEKHFASWLALCPNNKISGGKILRLATRKAANRAWEILQLCAHRSQSQHRAMVRSTFEKSVMHPKCSPFGGHKLSCTRLTSLATCTGFLNHHNVSAIDTI